MKPGIVLAAIAAIIITAITAITAAIGTKLTPGPASQPGARQAPESGLPGPRAGARPSTQPRSVPPPAPSVSAIAPSVDRVRQEAATDPHRPSPSVLRFSVMLGRRARAAVASEDRSKALFSEVSDCASNGSPDGPAEAARALCLHEASLLARRHPSLGARYDRLEATVDPRLVRIKKMLELTEE